MNEFWRGPPSPMRNQVCIRCGVMFQTKHGQQKYCGDDCRETMKNDLRKKPKSDDNGEVTS